MENENDGEILSNEIEFLKEVFFNEFSCMSCEFGNLLKIDVIPEMSDPDPLKCLVKLTLEMKISSKYPSTPPCLSISNVRGLEDIEIETLLKELHKIAIEMRGEPMLYNLVQHCSTLTAHNVPHSRCCICLEVFHTEGEVYRTPAFHYFHRSCAARYMHHAKLEHDIELQELLANNPHCRPCEQPQLTINCPVCREELSYDSALVASDLCVDDGIDTLSTEICIPQDWLTKRDELALLKKHQEQKAVEIELEEAALLKNAASSVDDEENTETLNLDGHKDNNPSGAKHGNYDNHSDNSRRNFDKTRTYHGPRAYRKGAFTHQKHSHNQRNQPPQSFHNQCNSSTSPDVFHNNDGIPPQESRNIDHHDSRNSANRSSGNQNSRHHHQSTYNISNRHYDQDNDSRNQPRHSAFLSSTSNSSDSMNSRGSRQPNNNANYRNKNKNPQYYPQYRDGELKHSNGNAYVARPEQSTRRHYNEFHRSEGKPKSYRGSRSQHGLGLNDDVAEVKISVAKGTGSCEFRDDEGVDSVSFVHQKQSSKPRAYRKDNIAKSASIDPPPSQTNCDS